MGPLLKTLEETLSSKVYIDVEMNSLEDAYINIANEEEKLIDGLKSRGMKRYSSEVLKASLSSISDTAAYHPMIQA